MAQCNHCGSATITPLFCDVCSKVLQVASDVKHDYYAFLGIEKSFDITKSKLESQYLTMQVKLHPDRFARNSEEERRIAAENSAFINIAYAALKNEFSRAEHMLLLAGIDIKDENYMQDDMDFLDLAFELRERAMTHDQEVLKALTLEVNGMRTNMLDEFSKLYQAEQMHDAAQALQRVRFLDRFLSEIELID